MAKVRNSNPTVLLPLCPGVCHKRFAHGRAMSAHIARSPACYAHVEELAMATLDLSVSSDDDELPILQPTPFSDDTVQHNSTSPVEPPKKRHLVDNKERVMQPAKKARRVTETSTTFSPLSSKTTIARNCSDPLPGGRAGLLGSYNPLTQYGLRMARRYYHLDLAVQGAFPTTAQHQQWILNALESASNADCQLGIDHNKQTILNKTASSLRMAVREAASAQLFYTGIPQAIGNKERIQSIVAYFTKDDYFIYREVRESKTQPSRIKKFGPFQNPVIAEIIASIFFNKRKSVGHIDPGRFNPIPFQCIAFVLTAMRCALDQYREGEEWLVRFEESQYGPIYTRYLEGLLDFQKVDEEACLKMQQEHTDAVMERAGITRSFLQGGSSGFNFANPDIDFDVDDR